MKIQKLSINQVPRQRKTNPHEQINQGFSVGKILLSVQMSLSRPLEAFQSLLDLLNTRPHRKPSASIQSSSQELFV